VFIWQTSALSAGASVGAYGGDIKIDEQLRARDVPRLTMKAHSRLISPPHHLD
jgi:hypothetical protein